MARKSSMVLEGHIVQINKILSWQTETPIVKYPAASHHEERERERGVPLFVAFDYVAAA